MNFFSTFACVLSVSLSHSDVPLGTVTVRTPDGKPVVGAKVAGQLIATGTGKGPMPNGISLRPALPALGPSAIASKRRQLGSACDISQWATRR